ncbi:hypothetical protein QBC41DRAFT_134680 [Cercophora samala]|uniref:NACHT domain-containing protein n=1 Tax=Cercophora samala TaxID=330535 RepID=A0AA40D8W2_9PEZI|nr:hypothetical protein QBC41DRAFT_134680 [Cercophora samala]
MSLVLAGATRTKAEDQLRHAVAQFSKDLNLQQQKTLASYKLDASHSPPSIDDVVRITTEIDLEISQHKLLRGRCFGTRFFNILESVQKYAALGDVVVGGSQNLIACGVWSIVRFSLLLMASFSSYVEQLSELLMNIGRSCPRYHEMTLLYPQSRSLRSNMCEYFTVIVRLCHQFLNFTKLSSIQQMKFFLTDQQMKGVQGELGKWAVSIKEEVTLLGHQSIEEQGSRLKAFMKSDKARQSEKAKIRVLNHLSRYDYQSTWKELRKAGSTTLLQNSSPYQSWKSSEVSTLICLGKLGSGKSVLLANIVADLSLNVGSAKHTVVYFFCRHDIRESLKAHTIIGSIIRQLLTRVSGFTEIEHLMDQSLVLGVDFDTGCLMLEKAFPTSLRAYIIVDGLDECDRTEREILYSHLQTRQSKFSLRICFFLRLEPDTSLGACKAQFKKPYSLLLQDENEDITNFIERELERLIRSKRLTLGDPTLIIEIADALIRGAQGMFLWVALQIAALCDEKTDADIRHALTDLPKDLHGTFSRILEKASKTGKKYQTRVLKTLISVYRPLTTEELREALGVVPGNRIWNPEQHINNIYSVLESCGSLVMVDEESFTVRFVHQSVVQFLVGGFKDSGQSIIAREDAAKSTGDLVMTYLSYDSFQSQVSTVMPQIPMGAAPSKIIHSMGISQSVSDLAVRLLRTRKQPDFDMARVIAENRKPLSQHHHPFYAYVKENWQQHSTHISSNNPVMCELLLQAVRQELKLEEDKELLSWALTHKHEPLIRALNKGAEISQILLDAMSKGDKAMVKGLLNAIKIQWEEKACQHTLWRGLVSLQDHWITNHLLEQTVVKQDCLDPPILSELMAIAFRQNNTSVVQSLFRHKAVIAEWILIQNVDVEHRDALGRSLLYDASCNHPVRVAEFLLGVGARVDSQEKEYGETPLLAATRLNRFQIVQLLVNKGANVDAMDIFEDSVLIKAVEMDAWKTVEFLLMKGANQHIPGRCGLTAFMQAIRLGDRWSEKPVRIEMMLRMGGSGGDIASKGRTALSYAAEYGEREVVEHLLRWNPNIDQVDDHQRTALTYAAECGYREIVELLVYRNASQDIPDIAGRTASHYAIDNNHQEVADILANGLDPERMNTLKHANIPLPARFVAGQNIFEVLPELPTTGHRHDNYNLPSTALRFEMEGNEILEIDGREIPFRVTGRGLQC